MDVLGGGDIPAYMSSMISNLKKINKDHDVFFLDSKTVLDYIPNIYNISKDMPLANKSDIIRLELLKRYGGIWLDSSSLVMEDLSWVHDLNSRDSGFDLIGYYRDESTIDYSRPIIESWFLCAPPNNKLIIAWLDALSPLAKLGAVSFHRMLVERDDFNEIKQNIGRPDYLFVYYAQQIAMRNLNNFNVYARMCESSAFLYQTKSHWNGVILGAMFCINVEPNKYPPIIKFTSSDRRYIDMFIKLKLINPKSIIGKNLP